MDHKLTAGITRFESWQDQIYLVGTDKVDEDDFVFIAFITTEVTTNRRGHNTQQG
jgi:hypothetical protein